MCPNSAFSCIPVYVGVDVNTGNKVRCILTGEHVIDGSFAVVLGDNFFHPKSFLCDLIAYHVSEKADATLGAAKVEDVTRHGIVMPSGDKLVDIVEKPLPEDAPSKLGAIGIYVYEPEIFNTIRRTKPGHKGEYQLTDSIKVMIDLGRGVHYRGDTKGSDASK